MNYKDVVEKVRPMIKGLESGMYKQATDAGLPFSMFLEKYVVEKGLDPTPFYGISNSDRLAYKAQMHAQGQPVPKAAFELFCDAAGVKAFGSYTDTVGKFFQAGIGVLFPEFVMNRVYAGAMRTSIIDKLIAERIMIQGFDFKSMYMKDVDDDLQLRQIGPGVNIPTVEIKIQGEDLYVRKFARGLLFNYEQLQYATLNYYGVMLQRIGDKIGADQSNDAIYTLKNGDGNNNGLHANYTASTTTSGSIAKLDLIKFSSVLDRPYQLDVYVGKKAMMHKVWDVMSSMTNPLTQWAQTGIPMPTGIDWDSTAYDDDLLLGCDRMRTAAYITNDSGVMTETDRIIARQQVMTTMTLYGVVKINDQKGIGALDITHS